MLEPRGVRAIRVPLLCGEVPNDDVPRYPVLGEFCLAFLDSFACAVTDKF